MSGQNRLGSITRMRAFTLLSVTVFIALAGTSTAQMAPMNAPATSGTPLTNAQLREEIVALRKEIVQLQHAQKMAASGNAPATGEMPMAEQGMKKCKDGMSMGMQVDGKMGCMGMPTDMSAKDPAATPMKKKGMGMMEKEDSMPMPAPDTGASKDPPASMPDKKCC